jgi:hypothetical protein
MRFAASNRSLRPGDSILETQKRTHMPLRARTCGDHERDDAEVHPDECRACSRFDR